jgi:cellulose synthase/poly-beta-1,6-N-acetylglucosamine synthase-like glycosyltransferase
VTALTLTVLIPAHNEQGGLPDTIMSIYAQTVLPQRIIVVDDGSTDETAAVARYLGVEVVQPPANLGSKAKAQNFGLQFVDTDLVLPLDADTTLDPDYIELLKPKFDDPDLAIAAGCVQSKTARTMWEKGRTVEYLYGFHWSRPIQNGVNAPVVCSGCCSVFRTEELKDFGGFPERTIVEDMDYTWSKQIEGRKAVYVHEAVARAADPTDAKYLAKQTWRWQVGFFQNVRLHKKDLFKKTWLAFWVYFSVFEILIMPSWYLMPILPFLFGMDYPHALTLFFVSEFLLSAPILIYAARRRKIKVRKVLAMWPYMYANKVISIWYTWKALICELILVPTGLRKSFLVYEKGRA